MQHCADGVGFYVGSLDGPIGGVLCGAFTSFFNEDRHDAGCDAPHQVRVTGLSSTAQ